MPSSVSSEPVDILMNVVACRFLKNLRWYLYKFFLHLMKSEKFILYASVFKFIYLLSSATRIYIFVAYLTRYQIIVRSVARVAPIPEYFYPTVKAVKQIMQHTLEVVSSG